MSDDTPTDPWRRRHPWFLPAVRSVAGAVVAALLGWGAHTTYEIYLIASRLSALEARVTAHQKEADERMDEVRRRYAGPLR